MDKNDLVSSTRILAITIGGLDESEVEDELEEATENERDEEKVEKAKEPEVMVQPETPEESTNRETELLDDFRYKILEDRGETMEENTLLRDLKDLKEKTLERKRARRLKKLKVKFQDRDELSPFQRSCCKCSSKRSPRGDKTSNNVNGIAQNSTTIEQESTLNYTCNGNPKCRPLAKMSSIDLYGCIIPKELMKL